MTNLLLTIALGALVFVTTIHLLIWPAAVLVTWAINAASP